MHLTAVFKDMETKAPVNKIIPFSNVDGPSNRTAIFFQGCCFDCLFCHNPETINMCVNCGRCVETCPVGALTIVDGKVTWNKNICVNCDTCLKTCTFNSSPKITMMTVDDVMEEISRTLPYIDGITCSGGECTLHYDFMLELFKRVKALGKTCLIDSNGSYDFEKDPRILEYCDGVMLDVKAVEEKWNEELISYPRDMVLKNLDYLIDVGKMYEVRTLIFPDRDEQNEYTIRYVSEHIQDKCFYKVIRYRPFGVREKNQKILGEFTTDEEYAEQYAQLARDLGATKAYVV